MTIDWRKVWKEFDQWCSEEERAKCEIPDWEEQKKVIQRLVLKHRRKS